MTKLVQTFMIATLAGTSLSGCAIFNGKEVWPGDRTFMEFVTVPIGELLRSAPDSETQFASETVTESEVTEDLVIETQEQAIVVETTDMMDATMRDDALVWDDVVEDYLDAPMTRTETRVETVETVQTTPIPSIQIMQGESTTRVLSNEELRALLRRSAGSTTQTSSHTVSSTHTSMPIKETVKIIETRKTQNGVTQAELQSMVQHSGGIKTKYKQTEYAQRKSAAKTVADPKTTSIRSTSYSTETSNMGTSSHGMSGTSASSMGTSSMSTSGTNSSHTSMRSTSYGLNSAVTGAGAGSTYATVDTDISYVRMGGGASLEDWRACEAKTGNYWTFDNDTHVGMLNPGFETCMRSQNYDVETSIKTEVIQPTGDPVTVTRTSKLP